MLVPDSRRGVSGPTSRANFVPMNKTILIIRIFFFALCVFGAWLVGFAVKEWDAYRWLAVIIGALLGAFVILVDIFLKGFSLRGLSALTFGLFVGWAVATFIASSPLFESGDPEILYLSRIALYVIAMYLASVIALRGKDEFNLVIPYVRFVPHGVEVPLVVVDTSALIDGRIVGLCRSGFLGHGLVIPRFVLAELQRVADSSDPARQAKGRKGLEVLNQLRRLPNLDLRIHESEVERGQSVDAKLIFLSQSLKAKLLTTDYNLSQLAEFHGIEWLNLAALARALNAEVTVGEIIEVDLVKPGREAGQAVGYLGDGSMVVVPDGRSMIGQRVAVEVESVLPSAGGRMVFGRLGPHGRREG